MSEVKEVRMQDDNFVQCSEGVATTRADSLRMATRATGTGRAKNKTDPLGRATKRR